MYKLSKKAEEDFGKIYEYTWLNFGEDQADDYTDDMDRCLLILSEAPLLGRDYSEIKQGIRRHDYKKHAIFYRIREQDIFILRILHQQMNPMLHL
ncbi:MAG TPA: type II toxin-antitoxin system RelE/ParE family toxin [Vibrio sp.]|uniref:type II toxin-antitoxin system RelE/ParE family toxin n=1 Tax=Vibrio sp. TaxID=678 RepID=UPI000EC11823|nr:type II toxin-antitoxin system RelE/ParE family toxin [Vibrio sp.]HCH02616.1 type II toxin-antitoxin system RelE/ParE family toxin [Vibrio sp.]